MKKVTKRGFRNNLKRPERTFQNYLKTLGFGNISALLPSLSPVHFGMLHSRPSLIKKRGAQSGFGWPFPHFVRGGWQGPQPRTLAAAALVVPNPLQQLDFRGAECGCRQQPREALA